jgi:hypothetical protein
MQKTGDTEPSTRASPLRRDVIVCECVTHLQRRLALSTARPGKLHVGAP